jgi:RNA polymerase sigma-70 factor (ECF subfamily)
MGNTALTPDDDLNPEQYRSYLRLLARLQLPPKVAAKVDASDIVQETMLQAHRGMGDFRGKTKPELIAWLRQILKHTIAHVARDWGRQKRDVGMERPIAAAVDESAARLEAYLAADQTSPSMRADRNDKLLQLATALEDLPDEQREAVELHYWHGWTLAAIGEHQGRTTASVAGLVHRGLAKLRGVLPDFVA